MKRFVLFQLPGFSLILLLLLAIGGCGRQEAPSAPTEETGTGSLAFQLQFGPNAGSSALAMDARGAANTTICLDYQIYQVTVKVLRSADDNQVAADSKMCNLGGMTINDVPAGVPLYVVCEGFAGADPTPIWRGQSDSFVVQPRQNYPVGTIRMSYQGSDHSPASILSTTPGNDSNIVLNTSIIINFNERLARSTVTLAGAFHLRSFQDNDEVNGTVVYEEPTPTTYRIRFTPLTEFKDGTRYYYTLSNLITDTAANPLAGELRWDFSTGSNHAPVVTITAPANHSIIAIDAPVQFTGSAVDQDDINPISDTSLVWTLDQGVQLGAGANLTANPLSAGVHHITLTAKDSVGDPGTAVITLHVGAPVPDTGQIASYTDTPGEDSDYPINPQSYTKLDASGNDLPDSATAWAMIRDNVTGLIWENKTDDPDNNITIHDKDTMYTWQDAQDKFIAQLNAQTFGGYNDWRLPTEKELSFIVNAGLYNPSINTSYFGNTVSSHYWSSTVFIYYPDRMWGLFFDFGSDSFYPKSDSYLVRAVRGGPLSTGPLVDNGDGTISDRATGLMWQKDNPHQMTWEQALNYCETLQLAGRDDWRLPNRNELLSIVDYTRTKPAIDAVFPNTMPSEYWSSTTYVYSTGDAWFVDFGYGAFRHSNKSWTYNVRAVRSGQ
ncbi:MAG: DUF1566 domain-containing protein [Desulfobacteraceae bacterium]|nr:DUF1566 domain-containing protein [Desulfobacteraceae bacterium]